MNHDRRNSFIVLSAVLLLLLAACGKNVQTAAAPVTNSGGVETALASTARALAQETETAQGFTPTPQITPTQTSTPTPKVSSLGTSLEKLADGTTRFTDHTAGIQVVFPADWLTVRVGELEYYQAWEKEASTSPVFQTIFATMQNNDPNLFRVAAIDLRSEVTYETYAKMEVVFSPDDQRSLNQIRTDQAQRKYALTKYKLLTAALAEGPNGLDTVVVEFQWESKTPENVSLTSYHREVVFKTPSGAVAIQLFTILDRKDSVMPEFEKVVQSLTLLDEQK